jgi:hypothetical protein
MLVQRDTLAGDGAFLVRLNPTDSLAPLALNGNAYRRYFGVRQHGERFSSVANTTLPYDGTIRLAPGAFLLEVKAFGAWSIVLN